MFIYTHVSTRLENVALILLKKTIPRTLNHIKSLAKKKIKRVKGLTCRKCTVI